MMSDHIVKISIEMFIKTSGMMSDHIVKISIEMFIKTSGMMSDHIVKISIEIFIYFQIKATKSDLCFTEPR